MDRHRCLTKANAAGVIRGVHEQNTHQKGYLMRSSTTVTHNAGDNLPRAYMGGSARNLPVLEFGPPLGEHEVTIAFYTTTDRAQYLRDLASLCIGLAEQVDALPVEVTA